MVALATRARRRLRGERGQASLELMIAFGAWWLLMLIFLNLFMILSTSMLAQGALDRAAEETAAFGCMTPGVATQLQNDAHGIGAHGFTLVARTPKPSGGNPYAFNRGEVVNADGSINTSGSADASCTSRDGTTNVANGDYIWVQLTYQQDLTFVGSITMHRSELVVSQSLQGNPPAGAQ